VICRGRRFCSFRLNGWEYSRFSVALFFTTLWNVNNLLIGEVASLLVFFIA
jgi:hypothetical protein